jgi:hypothetical protein
MIGSRPEITQFAPDRSGLNEGQARCLLSNSRKTGAGSSAPSEGRRSCFTLCLGAHPHPLRSPANRAQRDVAGPGFRFLGRARRVLCAHQDSIMRAG